MGESEELYFLTRNVEGLGSDGTGAMASVFAMIVPSGLGQIRKEEVCVEYPLRDEAAKNRSFVSAFFQAFQKLGIQFKEGDLVKKILGGDYEVFLASGDASQLCAHSSGDLTKSVLCGPNTRPFVMCAREQLAASHGK